MPFSDIRNQKEIFWQNPYKLPYATVKGVCELAVSDADIADAEERLLRFAPFLSLVFPETKEARGIIESPLKELTHLRAALSLPCRTFLKMDSHLAIAGSIKARGGIYEVLKHAEDLALAEGKITKEENYEKFAEKEMREFFSRYTVEVGSTGNLGLSIGIASAALGFKVNVHMSADAKEWKKNKLRAQGVNVIEYKEDYSAAVCAGREASLKNPMSYFVDDEKSKDLFLGYAVAAKRLRKQLSENGVTVDEKHPLIVVIPAGVGGAPGGVSYGLKRLYGDSVHCFFAEPTAFPSVLLGIATQRFEEVSVRDFGLNGMSHADGLACASPSSLVTRIMTNHLSGVFTVSDASLYDHLRCLYQNENIFIEPSACASLSACAALSCAKDYFRGVGITEETLQNATLIAWATGGSMVPKEEREKFLNTRL